MSFLGLNSAQWVSLGISAGIVIATLLLGRFVTGFLLDRVVGRLVRRTRTELDNVILETLRPSLYLLAIVISLQVALARLDFFVWSDIVQDTFFILYFLAGFFTTWLLLGKLFTWYGKELAPSTQTELDEQLIPFFRRVALIVLGVIGLIIILGYFEVNVSALVTTLGIGSLAIALAAQAALADPIAGFVIMIDRPYRIGDRIEIQDLDTWGDVTDIGLRSSRIRTRDNRMVIIPNSVIAKSLIVNHSFPDTLYRIQIHIGIAYGTDIEEARQILINAVSGAHGVSQEHPIEALFLEFGDSALIFRVRWWIDSFVDTRRMFDQVNSSIYKALNAANIEIPYPHRDLIHKVEANTLASVADVLRSADAN